MVVRAALRSVACLSLKGEVTSRCEAIHPSCVAFRVPQFLAVLWRACLSLGASAQLRISDQQLNISVSVGSR